MKRQKLSYDHLCHLELFLGRAITLFSYAPGENDLNKTFAAVLIEVKTKVERKKIGIINEKGYDIKLTPAQLEAVKAINTRKYIIHSAEVSNALYHLIVYNIKK